MPKDHEEQLLYTPLQRDKYLQIVTNYVYFHALSKSPLINATAPQEHTNQVAANPTQGCCFQLLSVLLTLQSCGKSFKSYGRK